MMKKTIQIDLEKVMQRLNGARLQIEQHMKKQKWVDDLRKQAVHRHEVVKKMMATDLEKVMFFFEKERRELAQLQKRIPSEVKKLQGFVQFQRNELLRFLENKIKAAQMQTVHASHATASSASIPSVQDHPIVLHPTVAQHQDIQRPVANIRSNRRITAVSHSTPIKHKERMK